MIKRKIVSRRANGVELVRGSFCWDETAESLVTPWIEAALRWLDETLLPHARRAFEEDPAADKRFFFRRYDYTLSFSIEGGADGEANFTVKAALSRGALRQEASRVERLRISDLAFLPPEKKKSTPKGASFRFNGVNR